MLISDLGCVNRQTGPAFLSYFSFILFSICNVLCQLGERIIELYFEAILLLFYIYDVRLLELDCC